MSAYYGGESDGLDRLNFNYSNSSLRERINAPIKQTSKSNLLNSSGFTTHTSRVSSPVRLCESENYHSKLESRIAGFPKGISSNSSSFYKDTNDKSSSGGMVDFKRSSNRINSNYPIEVIDLKSRIAIKDDELTSLHRRNMNIENDYRLMSETNLQLHEKIYNLERELDDRERIIEEIKSNNHQSNRQKEILHLNEIERLKDEKTCSLNILNYKYERELEQLMSLHNSAKERLVKMNLEKDEEYTKFLKESKEKSLNYEKQITEKCNIIEKLSKEVETCK